MRTPRPIRAAATVALAVLLAAIAPSTSPALASAQASATGPEGQTLTVSKVTGLAPAGERVTVTGSGYDDAKGIYVAFCVDNGPDAMPTPCGGGADMSGSLGASRWISSNPPAYGDGLAVPYGSGGSFSVTLTVTAALNDDVDCTIARCAVVTRADHTRSADRTQDVRVPVSFAGSGGGGNSGGGTGTGGANEPGTGGTGTGTGGSGTAGGGATGGGAAGGGTGTGGGASGPEAGVITAGPVPTTAPSPVVDALAVTRLSSDDSAGRWWLLSTGGLLALLGGLILVRLVARARRRRATR